MKQANPAKQNIFQKYLPWWIVLGVVIILLLWIMGSYNGLVSSDENVNEKWANVQTSYQRRADLIPNLVETVRGYRDYEQETLTQITQLRSEAGQAKIDVSNAESVEQIEAAAGQMNSVLSRLLVIVERYPDLKASENFLSLQDQLEGTENRIKVDRDKYNEAVKSYNIKVRRFPSNIIANMFGFDQREPFEAEEGADAAPDVVF